MQPVFKCDYCKFMGTEEEVSKHESMCHENYDRRSCFTCKHRSNKNWNHYECGCGKEIPEGQIIEFCSQYERKEADHNNLVNIFSSMFGGF